MKSCIFELCCLIALLGTGLPAACQAAATDQAKGFTEIESLEGTLNSSEKLLKLDSAMGYDFNRHIGVFAGLPIYFTNVSSNVAGTSTSNTNNGIGNFYLGFVLRASHQDWNFASTVTGAAPTGSTKKGYSSGRANVDWSNRVEYSFERLTPFVEAGLANTVPDSTLVTRPFTSLGVVGHLEEGGDYELGHHVSVGGSAYQILPTGNQKVFSKLVERGGPGQGLGRHHRTFELVAVSSGADLTRENGFNVWVGFEPNRFWRLETGYSRSMTYDFNSFTINLALNVGQLVRARNGK
jgi:hypothetical protein